MPASAPASPWTPVALSIDIPAGTTAPGRLGAQGLAVWRSASGKIAAWADRCPHRGMRLSHGFVRGEALSCIYHGWSFGQSGACQRIPAHPDLEPPAAIRVPRFACVEASGAIWVAETEEAPAEAPPAFPGFAGFRTLNIAAPAAVLRAALGGAKIALGPLKVVALVQPLGAAECNLHLLAPEAATPAALTELSRAAEALRRTIEAEAEAQA